MGPSREERVARALYALEPKQRAAQPDPRRNTEDIPWEELEQAERDELLRIATILCGGIDALLEGPVNALHDIADAIRR